MPEPRDWGHFRVSVVALLERRTGATLADWKRKIRTKKPRDEAALRRWLAGAGVTGYPQTLLVYETFGYPDYLVTPADELIAAQFRDRPHLRPIFDALLARVTAWPDVEVQARKTYVALCTPRRTFARIQAPARERLVVALRLDGAVAGAALGPSRVHPSMPLELRFASPEEIDDERMGWIRKAFESSR